MVRAMTRKLKLKTTAILLANKSCFIAVYTKNYYTFSSILNIYRLVLYFYEFEGRTERCELCSL